MTRNLVSCLVAIVVIATAATAVAQITPIHDVQYTTDPSGASPLAGQTVTVEGIVYGLYKSSGAPRALAVADAAGAWNGIYVYLSPNPGAHPAAVGDLVRVTGAVQEFNGLTEIVCAASAVLVQSSGQTPHAATVVTTAEIATGATTAEAYEGVLVEVQDVLITSTSLGYGEWQVDDGSGPARVNDDVGYATFIPAEGMELAAVRGMLNFSFTDFKIEPRDNDDIVVGAGSPYTIPQLQGSGFVSPHIEEFVETSGVVTGFFAGNIPGGGTFDAFLMQDPAGDADPLTSDGIMVIAAGLPGTLAIGDLATVTGVVKEYGEYDGTACQQDCMTTVFASSWSETGTGSVTTTTLDPPTDGDGQLEYFEALEGMRVEILGDATVVGPTSFGTVFAVDADLGVERVLRGDANDGKPVGARHWERFGDISGSDPPNLIVGSTIANVDGPLVTSYGDFLVATQAGDAWSVVASVPTPPAPPAWPPASADLITLATFNTYNFDDGDATHRAKVVRVIVALGCPTLLALEEVDTASTVAGGEDDVLPELIADLAAQGCGYASANSHPDTGDHGVAVLWRTDQLTDASWTTEYQGCSAVGSTSSTYDTFCVGVPGEFPLFSRRPVVVTATPTAACAGGAAHPITLIGAHLKSKSDGAPGDQRRLEQAIFLSDLVDTLSAGGAARVVVAGDLNDFEDSPALIALTGDGDLDSAWGAVAADERYSYIYKGVSQILDHVLFEPEFRAVPRAAAALHVDADFPFAPFSSDATSVWRSADHDPVVATFDACFPDALIFADGFWSGDASAWSTSVP